VTRPARRAGGRVRPTTYSSPVRARLRTDGIALVPGLLGLAILVYWAAVGGGYEVLAGTYPSYDPNPWYLGALASVGLLAAALLALGRRIHLSRAGAGALAALGLYVAFSYASILWAEYPGAAWDGANRTLVYFALLALFAILPWTPRGARLALILLVAAMGTIAVVQAVRIGTAAHPLGLYNDARLATPLAYQNANAALFNMTALLALALGARREVPWPLRGGALAVGALALQLTVLSQSRGWLFTLPLVVLAVLLAVPDRLRLALFAAGPVLATVVVLHPLLDVFRTAGYHGTPLASALVDRTLADKGPTAAHAMLVADSVLLVLALLAAWADSRVKVPPRAGRWATRGAAGVLVLAVLVGAGAGVAAVHGHVGQRIDRAWREFQNTGREGSTATRFTQLGSARYDLWKVGLEIFARHPLGGIGQDNYQEAYVARRRTAEEPRWPHSLAVRLLTHTGVIGAALFLAFLAFVVAAATRTRARRGPQGRAAAGIALIPLAVWVLHGSVDWLWEYPVLSGMALALAGIGVALARPAGPVPPAPRPRPRRALQRVLAPAAAVLATLAGLAVLGLPYVGQRDVARALTVWQDDPRAAFAALRRAAHLEPLNAQPATVAGAIALGLGRRELAREQFAQVAERNPRSWLAALYLGLLGARHDRRAAAEQFRRAHALNPREPLAVEALAALRRGRPLTLAQVAAEFDRRAKRFGP